MGSHLGICLLREQAVLPLANDISRQPSPWGRGRPLWGLRQQLMAKDWLPVSTAETQIEAANLQDWTKRKKKMAKLQSSQAGHTSQLLVPTPASEGQSAFVYD